MNGVPLAAYLGLALFMFSTGVVGVLVRRNPIVIFMSIELMLNAVNLTFVSFARYRVHAALADPATTQSQSMAGQMMVVFVMAVAAAEVAVGLGIIMAIFRLRNNIDIDDMNILKG